MTTKQVKKFGPVDKILPGLSIGILAFLAILTPPTAWGQPANSIELTIFTKTKFYNFRANKFRNVLRGMLRHAPEAKGYKRKVWAQAAREYDMRVEYNRSVGACSVKSAVISMNITYILPRLENESRVSPEFRANWQTVYRILRQHELAHGRNFQILAERLKAALENLKPQENCPAIKRAVKDIEKRLQRQDLDINHRFDLIERGRFTRLRRQIENRRAELAPVQGRNEP